VVTTTLQTEAEGRPTFTVPGYLPKTTVQITSFDEAVEVVRSSKFSREPVPEMQLPFLGEALPNLPPKAHITRRRFMNRLVGADTLAALHRLTIAALRTEFAAMLDLERAGDTGSVDLVQLTRRVQVGYGAAVLGLPNLDHAAARQEMLDLLGAIEGGLHAKWKPSGSVTLDEAHAGKRCLYEQLLSAKPQQSAEAVSTEPAGAGAPWTITRLASRNLDPGWSDEMVLHDALTLIMGIVENTTNTIVHACHELQRWLARTPNGRQRMIDLTFLDAALQESIRLHASLPHIGRVALEDVVLRSGRRIAAGEWVAVIPRAANVDPAVFGDDARQFVPERPIPPRVRAYGLSFGTGSHQCLGLPMVVGPGGVGPEVLRAYFLGGLRPESKGPGEMSDDLRMFFTTYRVRFDTPGRALAALDETDQLSASE
jgi:cytochrome P450